MGYNINGNDLKHYQYKAKKKEANYLENSDLDTPEYSQRKKTNYSLNNEIKDRYNDKSSTKIVKVKKWQ